MRDSRNNPYKTTTYINNSKKKYKKKIELSGKGLCKFVADLFTAPLITLQLCMPKVQLFIS